MQVELLKLPPATLALHDTVPLGDDGVPRAASTTVAAKVMLLPIVSEDGLGVVLVLVARKLTVRDEGPELVAWVGSPE